MSFPQEELSSLFELSRDPVLGIDNSRQTIAFVNPAAAALLGAQPGESADRFLPEYILIDPAEHFIASVRIGERRASVSVNRLAGITICSYSLPHNEVHNRPLGNVLQTFADSLMNLRLALDVLVNRTKAENYPVIEEAAQTLYREYHRLLRSCQHMRLAADIEQGGLPHMPQVVDLKKLCQELCDTVGNVSENLGISIRFTVDSALHLTMADSRMLETMLANLLANSLAHCKSGDVIKVDLSRQDNRFIIAVQDPGSGIAPEMLASIFNNESLTADMSDPTVGAGLGLYIARGIAERHRGNIVIESRPGHGTSIRISIPYKQSDTLQVNSPIAQYRSDGMNIVLTELSPLLDKEFYSRRYFD